MLTEPDAIAWTAARLLALQGVPSEADRLAERILKPAHGARYLLAGTPARMEHRALQAERHTDAGVSWGSPENGIRERFPSKLNRRR